MPESNEPRPDQRYEIEDPFEKFLRGVGDMFNTIAEAFGSNTVAGSSPSAHPASAPRPAPEHGDLTADIFDEGNMLVLVLEIPGVPADAIQIDVQDDIVAIEMTSDELSSSKEILLPAPVEATTLQWSCRNGILEVRLEKRGSHE